MRKEVSRDIPDEAHIPGALAWAESMIKRGLPAGPVSMFLGRPRRTLDQNDKLWPMLADISRQVQWAGMWLKPEDWKDLFTAALRGQRVVPGIDGGFVALGQRTSKMSVRELSELIEYMYAFGSERGVEWSETDARHNDVR